MEIGVGYQFFSLREAYISNLSLLMSLDPSERFVLGGGWFVVVIDSAFSVKLIPKPSRTKVIQNLILTISVFIIKQIVNPRIGLSSG